MVDVGPILGLDVFITTTSTRPWLATAGYSQYMLFGIPSTDYILGTPSTPQVQHLLHHLHIHTGEHGRAGYVTRITSPASQTSSYRSETDP